MRKNNSGVFSAGPGAPLPRARIKLVGWLFLALFILVTARLGKLMMASDEKVAEFAQRQRFGALELHTPRGMIYDRNMTELAVSLRQKSIFVNPRKVESPAKAAWALASRLDPRGGKETNRLARKLAARISRASNRHFLWVERKADAETAARVKNANIPGVGFVDEYERYYPNRSMAAKIIGFCGMDNQGLSGLEYHFDRLIQGVNSRSWVRKDALGRPVDASGAMEIPEAFAPADVTLTLDERLQHVAESALERKVASSGALGGVAIVMNPRNGEILAMAEQPRFNPNNYSDYGAELFKSRAISIPVEPGSTFKVFVAAAAMDENALRPGEIIDCENGKYSAGGKIFKEAHDRKFGRISVAEVIAQSSNIGAIKIAERLGREKLDRRLRDFGFGARTGVDLPGESPGALREVAKWSQISLPSISFGQEVAVTPIQLAAGFSAFANGGYLVKPRLVKALTQEGRVIKTFGPGEPKRVLSAQSVDAINQMMLAVVETGTGKKASVPGFLAAGKTGTAQVFDNKTGAYSEDRFISSFIGFFPVKTPVLTILVMIDSPSGAAWGGEVAAPVFSEIASRSAQILKIPGAGTEVYRMEWAQAAPVSAPGPSSGPENG